MTTARRRTASAELALCAIVALGLAGCATAPRTPRIEREASAPPSAPAPSRPGGYYLDDGPGDGPPPDLARIPDAQPRSEPLHRAANSPYVVFGKEYVPERSVRPFRQRGVASWYGRRFHGNPTSSGERYDMYAMTAAHPTLPIPSYARVTSVANGRTVVVRINDRGPFLHGRIIDLSYAAAWKLGYVAQGSALVEVEAVVPGEAAAAPPPRQRAATASDPVDVPVAAEPGGIYVQIGAFAAPENAESLRARLALELASFAGQIEIYRKDGFYRLHVGPYRTRAEANAAADEIRGALDMQPHLVVR
ncbi:MAG: septal ring lytic transglycosylase RlpA family protein [Burkholderiales bacterium]